MYGGKVVVRYGLRDDKGAMPVDFYTDIDSKFINGTYLVSEKNIPYLKDLCRIYDVKYKVSLDPGYVYPGLHETVTRII